MRHLFWRGVEAGAAAFLAVSSIALVVIWDKSKTKKPTVPQGISAAGWARIETAPAGASTPSGGLTAPLDRDEGIG